jgi:hypothetical protein
MTQQPAQIANRCAIRMAGPEIAFASERTAFETIGQQAALSHHAPRDGAELVGSVLNEGPCTDDTFTEPEVRPRPPCDIGGGAV